MCRLSSVNLSSSIALELSPIHLSRWRERSSRLARRVRVAQPNGTTVGRTTLIRLRHLLPPAGEGSDCAVTDSADRIEVNGEPARVEDLRVLAQTNYGH